MGFVGGKVATLKIQGMGYFAPDLIAFNGEDLNGSKKHLVQHVSHLSALLVAADKEDKQADKIKI